MKKTMTFKDKDVFPRLSVLISSRHNGLVSSDGSGASLQLLGKVTISGTTSGVNSITQFHSDPRNQAATKKANSALLCQCDMVPE